MANPNYLIPSKGTSSQYFMCPDAHKFERKINWDVNNHPLPYSFTSHFDSWARSIVGDSSWHVIRRYGDQWAVETPGLRRVDWYNFPNGSKQQEDRYEGFYYYLAKAPFYRLPSAVAALFDSINRLDIKDDAIKLAYDIESVESELETELKDSYTTQELIDQLDFVLDSRRELAEFDAQVKERHDFWSRNGGVPVA